MNKIPLSLLFFSLSRGHFGFKDIYLTTLNDLSRQVPLELFATKIAHIKVSAAEVEVGKVMEAELKSRGFQVIVTVEEWVRGIDHLQKYLKDVIRVSKELSVYDNPHILWLEDDSTMTCHKAPLEAVLARMTHFIQSSPDILTARFIRRGSFEGGVPVLKREDDYFYSPYTDFQPWMMRSRDFYLVAKSIEDNWDKIQNIQCEMLWRLLMAPFSRSELKHIVWLPDYAETLHLGSPEYPELKKRLGM